MTEKGSAGRGAGELRERDGAGRCRYGEHGGQNERDSSRPPPCGSGHRVSAEVSASTWRRMFPSGQLAIGGAARRARPRRLMPVAVMLLELSQDLVAGASVHLGDANADFALVSRPVRRRLRRSGCRRRGVEAGKNIIRRRDLDAVQIERADHAQRCGAVPDRRLFWRPGCLAVVSLMSRASGV